MSMRIDALRDRLSERLEMLKVLEHSGDTEAAHSDADDTLIACLKAIAESEDDIADIISEIITAYRNVPKWYA